MSIESAASIHVKSREETQKAPQYTREQFLNLYNYFTANSGRLSALPKEIADLERKMRPLTRSTKQTWTIKEKELLREYRQQYKELTSEQKRLLDVGAVLLKEEYRSLFLEATQQPAVTVLVARPQAQEVGLDDARVTLAMGFKETWDTIIKSIKRPVNMEHSLFERITQRYAAQEAKLVEALWERDTRKIMALFDKLAVGLRFLVAEKGIEEKKVVESILEKVKTYLDHLLSTVTSRIRRV